MRYFLLLLILGCRCQCAEQLKEPTNERTTTEDQHAADDAEWYGHTHGPAHGD